MLQLKITINTTNAAFDDMPGVECARILRAIADQIEATGSANPPRDYNGNRCGDVEVVEEA